MKTTIGIGLLKLIDKNDLKITKEQLLDTADRGSAANYYSKVAEVNERGELSGDETTEADSCITSSEDE